VALLDQLSAVLSTAAVSVAIASLSFTISGAVGSAVGSGGIGVGVNADIGIGSGSRDGPGDNADGSIDVPEITNHSTNTSAAAAITFIKPSKASPIVHSAD
jgi:hypothetical protein